MEGTAIEERQVFESMLSQKIFESGEGEDYSNVITVALDYANERVTQLQAKHKEEIKQAVVEAYDSGGVNMTRPVKNMINAEQYYQANYVTPVKDKHRKH